MLCQEALNQLMADGHLDVTREDGKVEQATEDLETVEIANWPVAQATRTRLGPRSHTSMVGETMCLLESLDPLQVRH